MNTQKTIMQNDYGYFVAEKVPMNNLSGCNLFFWQQVSKCYKTHGWAERIMNGLLRKDAMKGLKLN